ncbi:hypothetical protein C922_03468 [Plasmodium inui San Antonio 1]|uniref:Uncharacterized protein n=1 Tax=Plasmodium inui San Antonio 1 TaxID=1237626 RepID=W7A4P8_9APIC|nr:hypothetical protein C922_03468 [Plasmodium inui San Antonio 1]EUD66273.1 hypothetical protein C922_03468 [Plasmodium inui San Antonio 1]
MEQDTQLSMNMYSWGGNEWLGTGIQTWENLCREYRPTEERNVQEDQQENKEGGDWLKNYLKTAWVDSLRVRYEATKGEDWTGNGKLNNKQDLIYSWKGLILNVVHQMRNSPALSTSCVEQEDKSKAEATIQSAKWGDILWREICKNKTEAATIMGTLQCILKIWSRRSDSDHLNEEALTQECKEVLRRLQAEEGTWNGWIKIPGQKRSMSCLNLEGSNSTLNEDSQKIGLVLSIYRVIEELCPKCGPYSLTQWLKGPAQSHASKSRLYCSIRRHELRCYNNPTETGAGTQYMLYTKQHPSTQTDTTGQGATELSEQEHLQSGLPKIKQPDSPSPRIMPDMAGSKGPESTTDEQGYGVNLGTRQLDELTGTGNHFNGPTPGKGALVSRTGNESGIPDSDETSTRTERPQQVQSAPGSVAGTSLDSTGPTTSVGGDELSKSSISGGTQAGLGGIIAGVLTAIVLGAGSLYGGWRVVKKRGGAARGLRGRPTRTITYGTGHGLNGYQTGRI